MRKKIISLALCFFLCLTMVLPVYAVNAESTVSETETAPAGLEEAAESLETEAVQLPEFEAAAEENTAERSAPDKAAPEPDAQIQATTASGTCGDNLAWVLDDNGTMTISGSGAMTDYTGTNSPWYSYRTRIKKLVFSGNGITTIGDYAFYGCSNMDLDDKGFPSSLKSIGKSSFLSCSSITYLFFRDGVTSIGMQAFDYCYGLKRVTICGAPAIAAWAFGDCTELEEISFLGAVPSFHTNTFSSIHEEDPVIARAWYPPDNASWTSSVRQNYGGTITWTAGYHGWAGDDISWDLSNSEDLILAGTGATWDADISFYHSFFPIHSRIQWVSVSEGITALGQFAFANQYNATSYSLPKSLIRIGDNAFNSCTALEMISIPEGVREIGGRAFMGCGKLSEFMFYGHAPAFASQSFIGVTATAYYYPVYSWTSDKLQNYGGSITWECLNDCGWDGSNVTWYLDESGFLTLTGSGATDSYGGYASGFVRFSDEAKVAIFESGITEINSNFLESMKALESVNLPGTLTKIGAQAFMGCESLKMLMIPPSVTDVGANVFRGCSSLGLIRFMGHAPVIDNNAFTDVTMTVEYYPVYSWTSEKRQQYGGNGKITWKCLNECGKDGANVTWSLDQSGTLTMTGTGATEDCFAVMSGYSHFYDEIRIAVVGEGITDLNDSAFEGFDAMTAIRLPSTLERIGALTLAGCAKLPQITIPAAVKQIGVNAFAECSSLKKVYFLGYAPSFGENSFRQVTATVFYPANEAAWTAEVKKSYGGTITWAPSVYMTIGGEKISAKLPVKDKLYFVALISNGPVENTSWTSSDASVAEIDGNGLATAKKYGRSTITASTGGGYYTAECELQTLFWDVAGSADSNAPDYQYFYNPVYWAAEKGITLGYSSGTYAGAFGVGRNCERQDFTLFLYRLAGQPAPDAAVLAKLDATFTDVSGLSNSFRKAIAWAYGKGIIKGYTSGPNKGKFGNGLSITRREAMIMLWRYAGNPAPSAAGLKSARSFTDVKGIYKETTDSFKAIAWAAGAGIANGYTKAASLPSGSGLTVPCYGCDLSCLREQMITFLYRYGK